MMYSKAMLFSNIETADKILSTKDVAIIKRLGREVHPYDDNMWEARRYRVVYKGVFEKFVQNEELQMELMATGDSLIAECAVKDRIWGIGLSVSDENRFDTDKWKGSNFLGKVLMEVRSDIAKTKAGVL